MLFRSEIWVQSLGWEDPLENGKATHSSILAWSIPWTYSPWGHKESDTTELLIIIYYYFPSSSHRSLLLGNVKPSSVFSIDVIIPESRILRIGLDELIWAVLGGTQPCCANPLYFFFNFFPFFNYKKMVLSPRGL